MKLSDITDIAVSGLHAQRAQHPRAAQEAVDDLGRREPRTLDVLDAIGVGRRLRARPQQVRQDQAVLEHASGPGVS